MTDKPTDEIERRAEECLNSIEPKYIPGDVDEYLYSEESMKAMFAFGHSAAKEEVEGLKRRHDNEERILRSTISSMNTEHLTTFRDFHNKLTALEAENRAYRTIQKEFNYLISQLEACVDKADGCDEGPNAIIALRHRQAWEKRHKDILERLRKGSADE